MIRREIKQDTKIELRTDTLGVRLYAQHNNVWYNTPLHEHSHPGLIIKNNGDIRIGTTKGKTTTDHPIMYLKNNGDVNIDGKVAIGTDVPAEPVGSAHDLSVASNDGGMICLMRDDTSISDGNHLGSIWFQGDDPTDGTFQTGAKIEVNAVGTWANNDYGAKIIFKTCIDGSNNLTERMRINDQSDVIIGDGTTTTVTGGMGLAMKSITANDCVLQIDTYDGDSATGDSAIKLMNAGTTKWSIWNDGDDSNKIKCVPAGAGAGCYIAQTGTVWVTLSDERMKENITDLDKGLSTILSLKPRRFKFKSEFGGLDDIGFIAQEVDSVLSEVTDGDKDSYSEVSAISDDDGNELKPKQYNGLMGLSMEKIVPVLVKAVQELSAKVTILENK